MAIDVFNPEVWSKELNRNLYNYTVMEECVNRNYEGEVKNVGGTVHINQVAKINTSSYTTGGGVGTYQTLDGSSQDLVIDQQTIFKFVVNDINAYQANVNLLEQATNEGKTSIGLSKDTHLLARRADTLAGNVITGAAGAAINFTSATAYNLVTQMRTKLARANSLTKQNKGKDGKRPWLIVPPEILERIVNAPEVIHSTALGDEVVRKGAVYSLSFFDILESTNMQVDGSGNFTIFAGTNEAITYAEQITKIEALRDKDEFGDFVRGLYTYGSKTVQPAALCTMLVKAA